MISVNLTTYPAAISIEFIRWVIDNKIGNWTNLLEIIAADADWYKRETITFECTEGEAIFIALRWS